VLLQHKKIYRISKNSCITDLLAAMHMAIFVNTQKYLISKAEGSLSMAQRDAIAVIADARSKHVKIFNKHVNRILRLQSDPEASVSHIEV
jgi:glutamine synthetase